MPLLTTHYTAGLVLVSVLISIAASYAALSLADRVRAATTSGLRALWLSSGSLAMGTGIWSMHYLGMLSLRLPVPVYYYWPTVLLSLLLAIAASITALTVVSDERLTVRRILAGGLLMGAGVGGMHYVGMAAMRSSAMEHYNPWTVALSLLGAVGFSWLALWIAFALRTPKREEGMRAAASVVMGLGIASTHYIAMAGVRFYLCAMPFSLKGTMRVDALGETVIAIMTVLILAMALGTATLDKWRFRDLQKVHADLVEAQQALLESQDELREANAMLNELSVRDPLTGLYNRRHIDNVLETEMRRSARNRKPIALLLIDVDSFKNLNDGYGHQHGDACLRAVARVLEQYPRRGYDVVARYGGEEFILLLPEADGVTARAVAEAIRQGVLGLQIENQGAAAGVVTVSIGVCSLTPHAGDDPSELVREADLALYLAKRRGRNRVEMAVELAVRA